MSILDQAIPAEEEILNPKISSMLITGASGSGKKTVASTGPAPRLVIDISNRAQTLLGFKQVSILKSFEEDPNSPKAYERVERIRKELWSLARACVKDNKPFPWGTIILTDMSELFKVAMNWSLILNPKRGLGGAPAEHHWMPQMYNVENTIKSFLGLPCLVIVTGHEDIIDDEMEGKAYYLPKGTGKLRTAIPNWFNETYYAWREPGKKNTRFFLSTQGSSKREYLKSSMNQLESIWKDPIEVEISLERMLRDGGVEGEPMGIAKLISLWEKSRTVTKREEVKQQTELVSIS